MEPRLPVDLTRIDFSDLLPDVPAGVFDAEFAASCTLLDRFVGALASETATALRLPGDDVLTVDAILASRGWGEPGRLGLVWLLETLELYGRAVRRANGWVLDPIAPAPASSELKEAAVAEHPAVAPSFAVMELAAGALPGVLAGERRGEEVLFGPSTMGLWFDYFSNDNPLYAPNNRLTALACAQAVDDGAHVMEVGGGSGSAGTAVMQALRDAGHEPSSYLFSELQPAFLRRGQRAMQGAVSPGCDLRGLRYDINVPPDDQGVKAASFDLVFGVNTLHLAHDLVQSLEWMRSLLVPGGALILGELVRPHGDRGVHLELPFALLDSYRNHRDDRSIRPRPGFLTAAAWSSALALAGFGDVVVLPAQLARCVERYPGFYCAVITARRRT